MVSKTSLWRRASAGRFHAVCAVLAVGLSAATGAQPTTDNIAAGKATAKGPQLAIRGFVSEETLPGLFSFRRCEGNRLVPRAFMLNDLTPNRLVFSGIVEVRKVRREFDRPLYVELRGQLTDKTVNAQRFGRAVGHVESCADIQSATPAQATLYAEGDDPVAWRFVASNAGARLEIVGEKPIRFPAAAFASPQIQGATRTYDAWSRDDGGSVRIEVSEQICVHGGKEAAYGARMLVRFGSRSFEGCAARY